MHTRPKISPVRHTKQCWGTRHSANYFSVCTKSNSSPLQHVKQYWTKLANHSYCIWTEDNCHHSMLKAQGLILQRRIWRQFHSCVRLPGHLLFPDRFSIRVEEAISSDNIPSVRRQLISDLWSFYYALVLITLIRWIVVYMYPVDMYPPCEQPRPGCSGSYRLM